MKYNQKDGDIAITLSCLPLNEYQNILEVEIIDTGVGIDSHKIDHLFVPFQELRMKQDFSKVENFSIGMGLSCSHSIV